MCAAANSGVFLLRDGLVHFVEGRNLTEEQLALAQRAFPVPLNRGIMAGRAILDRAPAHVPDIAADPDGLTRRQRQVLELLCAGHHTADIVATLHLSPRTVESHIEAILAKLGANDRTHAVTIALKRGIIDL